MQDIRRNVPAYADPFYRLPPKPSEIPLQFITRKFMELDTDTLEQEINKDFEENSQYIEGVISEMYQGQVNHISRNHQNCRV